MFIDEAGNRWYKGNLHLHTNISDGKRTPEEAERIYWSEGYDFLAVTDHWAPSEGGRFRDMLLLPGCEYDTGSASGGEVFHILSVCAERDPLIARGTSPEEMIRSIHAAGGLAGLAHPAWSLNSSEDILRLNEIDFTEIYNSISGAPRNCRPYSGLLTDLCAVKGRMLPLTAADDTHFYKKEETCRSFIYVRADELSVSSIREAIRKGDYYASQGPRVSLHLTEKEIIADCSPCEEVVFFTDIVWEKDRAVFGSGITQAKMLRKPGQRFVRAEVRDAEGRQAWSQYVALS